MKPKRLKIKPYARLLTMLGDQLIKNERVALGEIIKNAYDADASWVKLSFEGFTPEFGTTPSSKIIIEDDGLGMTRDIVENHWVNPATPVKLVKKAAKATTPKGRVIQGEKGIGRFALLKIGRKIEITTRAKGESSELDLVLDVSPYGTDFIPQGKDPLFLDELSVDLSETSPATQIQSGSFTLGARTIQRKPYGTRIEISQLTSSWSLAKVEQIFKDMARLQSIFIPSDGNAKKVSEFELAIHRGDAYLPFAANYQEELNRLVEHNSVLKVEQGHYDESKRRIKFLLNGQEYEFGLDDPDLTGLKVYRDRVPNPEVGPAVLGTSCGPFNFAFYVFDFSNDAKGAFNLDGDEQKLIREHRVYLYRDGIRVYPYGDSDDDWLQTDVYRGTVKASAFLSNDQVVGYVNITQKSNPQLRDKTSREGLIDTGKPYDDFIWLLKVVLAWLRAKPYAVYREKIGQSKDVEIFKKEQVRQALDVATDAAAGDPALQKKMKEAATLYKAERRYLVQRAEATEHLAGVGLSVETASHDLMVALGRALTVVDGLVSQVQRPGELDRAVVGRELDTLRGILSFVQTQMKDVQLLFKSSKQRRKDVRIEDMLRKVERLFQTALSRNGIELEVTATGSPLVAKTTDAVVLQLLLNLFDNSVYWLQHAPKPRKIAIDLNGDEGTLVFSDNGPGIRKEDAPSVFEPFFTGKGEEGRGLGLYIAQQLLERHGYTIALSELKSHRILSGANFVVSFVKED